jgi:hypothetical protein
MASTMMAAHAILRGLSTSGRMASTSKATPILNSAYGRASPGSRTRHKR